MPKSSRQSVVELALGYLREQVAQIRDVAPRLGEDGDDIHAMRVALRRLRTTLTTCRGVFDPAITDLIRDELRWLASELSPARDAEVLHAHLREVLAEQEDELVLGAVRSRIDTALDREHRRAHEQIVEVRGSERYAALMVSLDAFLAAPPLGRLAGTKLDEVVPRLLRHDWKRLRRAYKRWQHASGVSADVALHDVRKAAKRLRYAAEMAAPAYGVKTTRIAEAAEAIQASLGEQQDSVVARQFLRRLGVQADNGFTFGRLHAFEEVRSCAARRKFEAQYAALAAPKLRRWLKKN